MDKVTVLGKGQGGIFFPRLVEAVIVPRQFVQQASGFSVVWHTYSRNLGNARGFESSDVR